MNTFTKILISPVLISVFAGCSSDWLDTEPTKDTGSTTVFESTAIAKTAVNGLCKLMTTPFEYYVGDKLSSQDFNGEGTIKLIYGDWPGNSFVFANRDGYAPLFKGTNYMGNISSIYCYYPWWYYYMIIGNANTIICNIDGTVGPETEKQFIKAQALTFRAYSYMMLAQIYCHRWSDSDGGSAQGVVLRLDTSSGEHPLCTMQELYSRIYKDLDDAISGYISSGLTRLSKDNWSPDCSVAYAVYARAALNRQDYATAAAMAAKAREGYPLMSNEEYVSGFNKPTSEWIWSSYSSAEENTGYFSWFARTGYNSIKSDYKTRANCINKELFDKLPESDIRRSLFLDGTGQDFDKTGGATAGRVSEKSELYHKVFEQYPDIPAGHYIYAYMQFKIKSVDGIGEGYLNHFRSSEMLLIEAEANYFLDKQDIAKGLLNTLNRDSGRDVNYSCESSDDELLSEIKFYRAVELWGEGFDWFDLKRWGDPVNRKTYANGGNFTNKTAFTVSPDENNGWTWSVPALETDYNEGIR